MSIIGKIFIPGVAFGVGDCLFQFLDRHRSLHKTPKDQRTGFQSAHVLERLDVNSVAQSVFLGAFILGPLRSRFRNKSTLLFKQTSRTSLLQRLWFEQFLYTPFGVGLFLSGKAILKHWADADANVDTLYYHAQFTLLNGAVRTTLYSWALLFPLHLTLMNRCSPRRLSVSRGFVDVLWATLLTRQHRQVEQL